MRSLPVESAYRNINRVLVGATPYYRLHLKDHGSRFDLLLDTLEEALIIRDGLRGEGFYFEEDWTFDDLQRIREGFRRVRLLRRKLERPNSFGHPMKGSTT